MPWRHPWATSCGMPGERWTSAAHGEGAREAAVTTDQDRVRQAALRGGGLPPDRTEVTVARDGGVGAPVTVAVTYRAPLVVPFVEWLFRQEGTVSARASMRQETAGEAS